MRRLTDLNIAMALSTLLVVTSTVKAVPNPAAWYCTQLGYEYQIRENAQGNQYGVCIFPDGSECSGRDYFRKCYYGESPASCTWPCQELACRQAGESVYLSECCEGLDEIYPAHIFDANCNGTEMPGLLPICSDCGNGICETWESKCNCPEDCRQPRIIYVDADATGDNNGSSWADAYNFLQDALADANSAEKPVEIRVAQGIYKPDQGAGITPGDRGATFQLINRVTLKGGYAGFGESDPSVRDIEGYESILSGDLAGDDVDVDNPWHPYWDPTWAENSRYVVTTRYTDETSVLDGFTVTGGDTAMSIRDSRPAVGNCTFTQNHGAAMHNYWSSPTVVNCIFSANVSESRGGGMYNHSSNPVVTNCIFSDNGTANPHGLGAGGGAMFNGGSNPVVTNCKFARNYTFVGGGAIVNDTSSPRLVDCILSDNFAVFEGGAMYNCWYSSPTVSNCTFSGNSASSGGAIQNDDHSSPALANCTLTGNSAILHGGGMFNRSESSPTLVNCIFSGNWANENGGGMYNTNSEPTLTDCTFRRNRGIKGGGMYNDGSKPVLNNCTFSENGAWAGGGIGNEHHSSPKLVNCVFSGNSADDRGCPRLHCFAYGGGMYSEYDSNPSLVNCTFTGNKIDVGFAGVGGGIYCGKGTTTLRNCILWDNTGGEVYAGGTLLITYSDVQGGQSGEGNIDSDPCFAEPGHWDPNGTPHISIDDFWVDGDYHLKSQAGRWDPHSQSWVQDDATSPCIDGGDMSSPIGFEPFPNGGIINMGAYGGTAEASKSYFGEPVCETIIAGDINGDCTVNFKDFSLMAFHWLEDNTLLAPPPPRR